jgi:hypothetical protein
MICPMCGRPCDYAETMNDIVTDLVASGFHRNYTILCAKAGEGRFRAATKMYRVDFAHPKQKHIILITPRSQKTDATRASRLALKEKHLRAAGWRVSKMGFIPCR